MTSSKTKKEIKLDANQLTDFNGNIIKLEKNNKSVKDFYLEMKPGRPNFDEVIFI
jgi:hypothetical protein